MTNFTDVSSSVLRFREAARHNWNTYFQGLEGVMGPDVQEAYSKVEEGLFHALVMSESDRPYNIRYRYHPLPFLLVAPSVHLASLELRVGSQDTDSIMWDTPVRCDIGGDSRLEFIRFFDWNPYDQISMSMVQVHIAKLDLIPELVGKIALVLDHDIRFLMTHSDKPV